MGGLPNFTAQNPHKNTNMSHCRHWKQRFDVSAEMVFRKSRKLGLCGKKRCEPGDPVTEEMKQTLGRHRLKMWWEAGMIELRTEEPQPSQTEKKKVDAKIPSSTEDDEQGESMEPGTMLHTGGGWYTVLLLDGSEHRIRGKKKAKELLSDG